MEGLVWGNIWQTDCIAQARHCAGLGWAGLRWLGLAGKQAWAVGHARALLPVGCMVACLPCYPCAAYSWSLHAHLVPACLPAAPHPIPILSMWAQCLQVDPATGTVVGWLRATDLRNRALGAAQSDAQAAKAAGKEAAAARNGAPEVLNGIAYDAEGGRLFITGGCRGQGHVRRVALRGGSIERCRAAPGCFRQRRPSRPAALTLPLLAAAPAAGKLWPRIYQIETAEVAREEAAAALELARKQCIVHQ